MVEKRSNSDCKKDSMKERIVKIIFTLPCDKDGQNGLETDPSGTEAAGD